MSSVDYAVLIPTLAGSTLSAIGSGFILLCYAILPQKKHFRHALIINLALTDFLNALNNTISGFNVVRIGRLATPSAACTTNGFVNQLTVQATDINILAIAIVTLLVLKEVIYIPDEAMLARVLICCAVWLLPIITSFTALGLGLYGPVSGNWCWLKKEPTYMRYVLTHGWRFAVIFASSGIYLYIYYTLDKKFKKSRFTMRKASHDDGNLFDAEKGPADPPAKDPQQTWFDDTDYSHKRQGSDSEDEMRSKSIASPVTGSPSPGIDRSRLSHYDMTIKQSEARVKRTLLLNAYPIMYILLWLPGIANRIAEASGHPTKVLVIAQASTQFVGLANAITYGINERVWAQLKALFGKRGKSAPANE